MAKNGQKRPRMIENFIKKWPKMPGNGKADENLCLILYTVWKFSYFYKIAKIEKCLLL